MREYLYPIQINHRPSSREGSASILRAFYTVEELDT